MEISIAETQKSARQCAKVGIFAIKRGFIDELNGRLERRHSKP